LKREWEINGRDSRLDKNDFLAGQLVAHGSGWWNQTALLSGSALTRPVRQPSGSLSLNRWGELLRTKTGRERWSPWSWQQGSDYWLCVLGWAET